MTATPVPLRDFLFGFGIGVIAGELGHILFDNDNYRWAPHHWTLGPPLMLAGGIWSNWFVVGTGAGLLVHDAGDIPKIFETSGEKDEPSWIENVVRKVMVRDQKS